MEDHPNARIYRVSFLHNCWRLFRKALIDFITAGLLAAAGVGVVVSIALLVSVAVYWSASNGTVADKSILSPLFSGAVPAIALVMWIVSTSTIWWTKLSNTRSCEHLSTYREVDED